MVALFQKLTSARMAALCDATGQRRLYTDQVPPNQGGTSWSAQGLFTKLTLRTGKLNTHIEHTHTAHDVPNCNKIIEY